MDLGPVNLYRYRGAAGDPHRLDFSVIHPHHRRRAEAFGRPWIGRLHRRRGSDGAERRRNDKIIAARRALELDGVAILSGSSDERHQSAALPPLGTLRILTTHPDAHPLPPP